MPKNKKKKKKKKIQMHFLPMGRQKKLWEKVKKAKDRTEMKRIADDYVTGAIQDVEGRKMKELVNRYMASLPEARQKGIEWLVEHLREIQNPKKFRNRLIQILAIAEFTGGQKATSGEKFFDVPKAMEEIDKDLNNDSDRA